MKTKLPVTIAFLTGIFMAFAYFVERDNVAWVRILYEELNQNNIVLAVFVLFCYVVCVCLFLYVYLFFCILTFLKSKELNLMISYQT